MANSYDVFCQTRLASWLLLVVGMSGKQHFL
jgi:hypothetical protein